jgi:hypothetical protein
MQWRSFEHEIYAYIAQHILEQTLIKSAINSAIKSMKGTWLGGAYHSYVSIILIPALFNAFPTAQFTSMHRQMGGGGFGWRIWKNPQWSSFITVK